MKLKNKKTGIKIKGIMKHFVISILCAIFTFSFIFGGYQIFYAEAEGLKIPSFYMVQGSYHNQMNNYFNDRFEQISKVFGKGGSGIKDERLYPPTGCLTTEECVSKCTVENLSAFCVGMISLNVYKGYVIDLGSVKNNIFMNQDSIDSPGTSSTMSDLNQLIPGVISTNTDVDLEVQNSRKVLEGTVGVYNEFIMSYPMHQKYEEIIKSLIKYKTKLKTLKNQVKQFPANFIDTTSTKCL